MNPLNLIVIGNGHYASGQTPLAGVSETDKDTGVFLPAAMQLRKEGLVGQIGLAARDGDKAAATRTRFSKLAEQFAWDDQLTVFPHIGEFKETAYADALRDMPKPCVALIAVPDSLHEEVMIECARQKVPFLVVKPALTNLESFYRVLREVDEHQVFGMVDYHKVFDQMNVLLMRDYRAGRYGRIYHAHSLMTQRRDMLTVYEYWLRRDKTMNVNHYLGSHYAHLVGFITGAEPFEVRATSQKGIAAQRFGEDVADLIEMQIGWRLSDGAEFISYHVSGWSDPPETESMTYQSLQFLSERGHVDSDQQDRGFRTVLDGVGSRTPNPYFFNLAPGVSGELDLSDQYGYRSVKAFVGAAGRVLDGEMRYDALDHVLPTLRDSERVTAVLSAADLSLAHGSEVIGIARRGAAYILQPPRV